MVSFDWIFHAATFNENDIENALPSIDLRLIELGERLRSKSPLIFTYRHFGCVIALAQIKEKDGSFVSNILLVHIPNIRAAPLGIFIRACFQGSPKNVGYGKRGPTFPTKVVQQISWTLRLFIFQATSESVILNYLKLLLMN